ncbi:nitroreductase/quinone reductase family protein [Microbispora sp. CA-102843]|uniref:nitroreductase/quinone reductase family protein n=1 Tax=Microbispora sp. CA-102843 TaxID=3239952 RepID=UPI003D8F326C
MARRSRLFNLAIKCICDWQVRTYRRTGGRRPATMRGIPVLLLTTRGRGTGLPRTRPVGYGRDGRRFVVIASNGGDDATPAWWLNLRTPSPRSRWAAPAGSPCSRCAPSTPRARSTSACGGRNPPAGAPGRRPAEDRHDPAPS